MKEERESFELDAQLKEIHDNIEEAREVYQTFERRARTGKYEDPPIQFLISIYALQRQAAEIGRMLVIGQMEEARKEMSKLDANTGGILAAIKNYQQPPATPEPPKQKREDPPLEWV